MIVRISELHRSSRGWHINETLQSASTKIVKLTTQHLAKLTQVALKGALEVRSTVHFSPEVHSPGM